MKESIKDKLRETFMEIPFRLPKEIHLSDEEIIKLKNISWSDIKINDLGGTNNVAHLSISLPFKTEAVDGIIIDIQVLNNEIYQLHMHMSKNLQGLGLGSKIIEALINDLGHLYSGNGRILNKNAQKIWDKVKNSGQFYCLKNTTSELCMTKDNQDKEKLSNFMS